MKDYTSLINKLRDYSTCSDDDVDEAANAIEYLLKQCAQISAEKDKYKEYLNRLEQYRDGYIARTFI
jgi:hypothetical protein